MVCNHVGHPTKVTPGSYNRWYLRQPKKFRIGASHRAPKGPPGWRSCKDFWLSQTSPILTPRCDLSWTTDMVTNHVWLQVRHGYKTCLVTGLNSPDQNKKTEFKNMHYKSHKVNSKLPVISLTLPLSHWVTTEDSAKSLPLKLNKHYRGSCCSASPNNSIFGDASPDNLLLGDSFLKVYESPDNPLFGDESPDRHFVKYIYNKYFKIIHLDSKWIFFHNNTLDLNNIFGWFYLVIFRF